MRRGAALVALVVALAVLVWLIQAAFSGPDGRSSIGATPQATPTQTTPTTPTSGSAMPSATTSGTPSVESTASASASGSPSSAGGPASATSVSSSTTPSASPTPTKSATPTPTGPVICNPATMRVIPTGARQVVSGRTTTFRVHLVNTSDQTCILDFATTPMKFWINSGEDRIHTTDHCASWPPKGRVTLKPTQRYIWAHTWTTKRSVNGCGARPDYLRPGTYVANATLGQGQVNQWVLRLTG